MPTQLNQLYQISHLMHAWNLVKAKGSIGGVDGVSIEAFEKVKHKQIVQLSEELKERRWKPQPYLEIEIAKIKEPEEVRRIGMTAVRDKIVQQAIKTIIEPRYERIFLGCSYGYRPGKGPTKAIRRLLQECNNKSFNFVLRLDIDNFFDTIDHEILQKRLVATGTEPEVVRLIMLCVKMGKVRQGSLEWKETEYGTPQGAILSPILSNLYLHSFDQFAISNNRPYIRYADDFIFLTDTRETAELIAYKSEKYLNERLNLNLNHPIEIKAIEDGFEFLGINILNKQATITDKKRRELCDTISTIEFDDKGISAKSNRIWQGLSNYYGRLLQQQDLEYLDSALCERIHNIIKDNHKSFGSKSSLLIALKTLRFLSHKYQENKRQLDNEVIAEYANLKHKNTLETATKKNSKIIQQRKQEYRKIEVENSGILINKPGIFIGLTNRGVTISQKGKVLSYHHPDNLSQIVITGQGVSMSSNLVSFCMNRKIPIDFFDAQGTHLGSIISAKYMQSTYWRVQANAKESLRHSIALKIISGKIKNQHALLKYFNKYHKSHYPNLQPKMDMMQESVEKFKLWQKSVKLTDTAFLQELMGHEAHVALRYWDYIRELLTDDNVDFEKREHQGANDIVNSMLNYGYAILYARVWQALLAARLNPYESLIHATREGKPTLVYDFIELFRCQVVDRVVISLIQKGQELTMRGGLLADHTRQLLVKSIMERLARYEKFQGQEIKMEQIILSQAKSLSKAFEGVDRFKPYVAKW